jgi:hypothetical protein
LTINRELNEILFNNKEHVKRKLPHQVLEGVRIVCLPQQEKKKQGHKTL